MRRLAGCLVVSLLASAAAWVGCRDDLGDETLPLLAGSGTDVGTPVPDVTVVIDARSVIDVPVLDVGIGEGSGSDAASGSDAGGDAYGGGGSDGGGGST